MPNKKPMRIQAHGATPTFRQRYDALEEQRLALINRLQQTGEAGRRHPSARKALTLLNRTFRKATIVQRAAILQAAEWLVRLVEFGGMIV